MLKADEICARERNMARMDENNNKNNIIFINIKSEEEWQLVRLKIRWEYNINMNTTRYILIIR